MPNEYPFRHGDLKYYWTLHKERCHLMGTTPVTYAQFTNRLKKGILLKDAIYTPSNTNMNRYYMKPNKYKNRRFRFISFFK